MFTSRSNSLVLIVMILFQLSMSCQNAQTVEQRLIINVRIVDVETGSILPQDAIWIQENRIHRLGNSSALQTRLGQNLSNDQLIDAQGAYVIPGLADLHIHLRGENSQELALFLFNGITTVRNMNGADGGKDHVAIGKMVESGDLLGPRYFTSTPFVERSLNASNAVEEITRFKSAGYHGIKVHGNMALNDYQRMLEVADSLDFPVYGHAQRDKPLEHSLRLKEVTHVEEFLYTLDSSRWEVPGYLEAQVEQIAASGVTVEPTLSIYGMIRHYFDDAYMNDPQRFPHVDYVNPQQFRAFTERNPYLAQIESRQVYEFIQRVYGVELSSPTEVRRFAKKINDQGFKRLSQLTRMLYEAGVTMIAGSDSFGLLPQGFGLHMELQNLQAAGIPAREVLKMATINAAQFMGLEGVGAIKEGNKVDLVMLEENPLTNISATLTIRGIMYRNVYYDKSYIRKTLESIRASYRDRY